MKTSLFYLPCVGTRQHIEAGNAGLNGAYYDTMLREVLGQCQLADELGYDSVSFTEHHFHSEGFELSNNPVLLDLFVGLQPRSDCHVQCAQVGLFANAIRRTCPMATPRLVPLTPENLDEDQRALYDAVVESPRAQNPLFRKFGIRDDGSLAGPFDAWLRTPALGGLMERVGLGLRELTELPPAAREVAILVVGAAWRATFEWFAHSMMAKNLGVPDAVIDAIGRRRTPDIDDPAMLAAHDVARELVHERAISDATYARAAAVLGERGLVEVVCNVGFYQMVSGILESFLPPLHPDITGPPPVDGAA